MPAHSRADSSVPGLPLRERWLNWRHRLIASPRFQRWAARFPLTRRLAHRKASQLFSIATGFVYTQVLSACVSLDLFQRLSDGARNVDDLARECGMPREGMLRLLKAGAALELLGDRGNGLFGLGDLGAAMLGNPGVTAMVAHHRQLYRDLADPLALLRGNTDTELSHFWPYATGREGDATEYTELMSASQSLVAGDILDAYSMDAHRHLWDIAGGNGSFAGAALARWPALEATVLDLPGVTPLANQRFAETGLGSRARALTGDMFSAPLGEPGAHSPDLVSLVRVVHDHDDDAVMELFRALHRDMSADATLLVAEPMAGTPGAEAMGDAYFGFYLMAMGSGRPRTGAELSAMLEAAGFSRVHEVKTARPLLVRALVATP